VRAATSHEVNGFKNLQLLHTEPPWKRITRKLISGMKHKGGGDYQKMKQVIDHSMGSWLQLQLMHCHDKNQGRTWLKVSLIEQLTHNIF
jgi:hypothetical protein